MKLSEAIRIGSTLRPETHVDRFVNIEGKGLCSDVWGAACEAVQPLVAQLNWNHRDKEKYEKAAELLNKVQHKYFAEAFLIEAVCPGSKVSISESGGRSDRAGNITLVGEKRYNVPITSECKKVRNLAGLADHLFHKHRWIREQVADAVEIVEEMRNSRLIIPKFEHFVVKKFDASSLRR